MNKELIIDGLVAAVRMGNHADTVRIGDLIKEELGHRERADRAELMLAAIILCGDDATISRCKDHAKDILDTLKAAKDLVKAFEHPERQGDLTIARAELIACVSVLGL